MVPNNQICVDSSQNHGFRRVLNIRGEELLVLQLEFSFSPAGMGTAFMIKASTLGVPWIQFALQD